MWRILSVLFIFTAFGNSSTTQSFEMNARNSWRTKRGWIINKLGQAALVSLQTLKGDPCSVRKLWEVYLEVTSSPDCDRCDKYFHCKANFNAVHVCMQEYPAGNFSRRFQTAQAFSYAREFGQKGTQDSMEDQIANRFGRNGGNCEAEYLVKYGCYYDPLRKICKKSNK